MMKSMFELFEGNPSDEIVAALLMTYSFDADLFEQHVLPALFKIDTDISDNERRFRHQVADALLKKPVTVMVDAAGYKGGKTFLYDLLNVKDCTFHPKCFLLQYTDYLRVIIGSCNLTRAGLCYNAELIWHYDIRKGDKSGIGAALADIIKRVAEYAGQEDNAAIRQIIRFLSNIATETSADSVVIHSSLHEQSFVGKLHEIIEKQGQVIRSLRVMSPFYESEYGQTLESSMMGELFSGLYKYMKKQAVVEFCFPGYKTEDTGKWHVNAPLSLFAELSQSMPKLSYALISEQWTDEDDEPRLRPLHAKLIEVGFQNGEWLYVMGSPNFTKAAMNSSSSQMKNVEIGVFEFTKKRLWFPPLTKVDYHQLITDQPKPPDTKQLVIFIDSAWFSCDDNNPTLRIYVNVNKAVYPFEVIYQQEVIYRAEEPELEIIIPDFTLGHDKDLEIKCGQFSFTVPISVKDKYAASQDDISGGDFEPGLEDILDYYAGKYRSTEDIMAIKRNLANMGLTEDQAVLLGFRRKLGNFFKALDGIKQCLERPAWSEAGFKYEIYAPWGLDKLTRLFEEEYINNSMSPQEAFFYAAEMAYMLSQLNFEPDQLTAEEKMRILAEISSRLSNMIRDIFQAARGRNREQYRTLLRDYGLRGLTI